MMLQTMMSDALLVAFVLAALASAMPLLLAATGETIGEQSGVLNIGLEGLLLIGGYAAFAVTLATGQFWFGFLAGAAAGCALSGLMVVLAVWLRMNQIVVGIGITLAGTGISSLLYDLHFADTRPRLGAPPSLFGPPFSELPITGPVLFGQPGVFFVAIALVVVTGLWLHRTMPGLRLRAAGQRPESLDAVGGNVTRIRSLAVLTGGAFAGLGGAYLALVAAGTFTPGMTHGLGFLAIVVAMLGRGRVFWVSLIALLYGCITATATALQLTAVHLPTDLISIIPFIVVMIALTVFGGRSSLPPALTVPYMRGQR